MSTTLTISHYLYLTKAERYAWQIGQQVDVVGVSIPVWFCKGISSEPAIEVFAKYHLIPSPEIFIKHVDDGYEITVPIAPATEFVPLSDDIWKSLTLEEQEKWYEANEPTPSLRMLLDNKDGGSKYLAFCQHSKVRKNKRVLNVVHFMEIKDIDALTKTLT